MKKASTLDLDDEEVVKALDVYHTALRARAMRLANGPNGIGWKAATIVLVVAELVGAVCDTVEAMNANDRQDEAVADS